MARALRRLGLNAVFLEPRMGGTETYVRRLVPELLRLHPELEVFVFVNRAGRELLGSEPWAGDVRFVVHPVLGPRFTRALGELTVLGPLAARRKLDVLHSVAFTGPLRTSPAHVLTVPDVIWMHEPGAVDRKTEQIWRLVVPRVARRADRLLTYSEASRRDISASLGIRVDRIDAVPLGPGTEEQSGAAVIALGRPIVLSVSALRAHKNLPRLVEAMREVRESVPGALLVIPGKHTAHSDELRALAAELGIGKALVLPGWVDAAELEGLYAAAACFVFPSRREGFGLPVLEAMRRGVPVACSNTSSLPEVAGDAALLFDPDSPSAIASAIRTLLEDRSLATQLAAAGRERAGEFTWRRTAEGTLECYERAMRARRDPVGR